MIVGHSIDSKGRIRALRNVNALLPVPADGEVCPETGFTAVELCDIAELSGRCGVPFRLRYREGGEVFCFEELFCSLNRLQALAALQDRGAEEAWLWHSDKASNLNAEPGETEGGI